MPLPKEQFLPSGAKLDLAKRQAEYLRGGVPEVFKKAVKETYDNPLVNAGIGFAPVLGDLQAAGETVAALRRGAPWHETAGYAAGMLPFVPALRTTWHGSPHGFTKFDMSKVGTGEGSQAFGHGLYLAEAPETAKQYQAMANNPARRQSGLTGEGREQAVLDSLIKLNAKKYTEGDVNKLAELVAQRPAAFTNPEKMIQRISEYQGNAAPSYLYKVELPDEQIAKMLDYDLPFSQQSEYVKNALMNAPFEVRAGGDYSGADLYDMAQSYAASKVGEKNPAGGSALLNELGIPGIQYLDQASRGANPTVVDSRLQGLLEKHGGNAVAAVDEFMRSVYNTPKKKEAMRESFLRQLETPKTHNYVVFDDKIPQILERNGTPITNELRQYQGSHKAPGPEYGAQFHNLSGNGMYPEDVYSKNGPRYYGSGFDEMDKEAFALAHSVRNNPDALVDIYRAVPNEKEITSINPGDWVAITKAYADQHGASNLPEGYKILQQKVPARNIWTNADSIQEFGYWPD